jgi:hypothetical protein
MAATSTPHHHPLIDHFIEIAKGSSLRTVFLHAPFPFFLYTAYVAGRDLQLILESGKMHARETLKSLKEDIILLMLAFHHARSSLSHTKPYAITLLSGAVQMSGNRFHIFFYGLNQAQLNKSRPQNKEELFNLRHSSARNAIERIFGVLKRRFRILLLAPEYSLEVQARIPAALASLHNFISIHNPHDQPISSTTTGTNNVRMYDDVDEYFTSMGADSAEHRDTDLRRDRIAQKMWDDYVLLCMERGIDSEAALESDLENDEDESESEGEDEDNEELE